ncbi:transcriptional regulator, LytTR family [Paenibacillaceae bacterium GAS479]|nr:transcriptional regulator, LytTR family [Paenibacillaceae bacterium GAS479]
MVNVPLKDRNVYEDFDVETDILYYRLGSLGLVSFHGSNYNIKKKLSAEQITSLRGNEVFFPVTSGCYVNTALISTIEDNTIYFGSKGPESKRVPLSRWKAYLLRSHLSRAHSHSAQ